MVFQELDEELLRLDFLAFFDFSRLLFFFFLGLASLSEDEELRRFGFFSLPEVLFKLLSLSHLGGLDPPLSVRETSE